MKYFLILGLLLTSTIFSQRSMDYYYRLNSPSILFPIVLNSTADSVKAHFILDPVYASEQSKTYFTKNYASTDSLKPESLVDTTKHIYNPMTAGQVLFFPTGDSTALYLNPTSCTYLNPLTKSFTVEIIFLTMNEDTELFLFGKHGASPTFITYYYALTDSNTIIYKFNSGVSSPTIRPTDNYNKYQWYYCAAVADYPNEELNLYINGSLVGTSSFLPGSLEPVSYFMVGSLEKLTAKKFKGFIPEIRISFRKVGVDEITSYWARLNSLIVPTPPTPTINAYQENLHIAIDVSNDEMALVYKGTSPNPTTILDTVECASDSILQDYAVELGTTYYYRIRTFRPDFSGNLKFSDYASDTASIQNYGTNLITDAIDYTFEIGSPVYISDFSAGTNSWGGTRGTVTGNVDAISDGSISKDDVLRFWPDNVLNIHFLTRSFITINKGYALSWNYYIPTANTNVKGTEWTSLGASLDISAYNSFVKTTTGAWTLAKWNCYFTITTPRQTLRNVSTTNFAGANSSTDDLFYMRDFSASEIFKWNKQANNTNHYLDTTTTYSSSGSYSMKIISTGAGSESTHYVSLPIAHFTTLVNGSVYRVSFKVRSPNAGTTITVDIGDKTSTAYSIPTDSFGLFTYEFTATASSVSQLVKLYLNQTANVYIDDFKINRYTP